MIALLLVTIATVLLVLLELARKRDADQLHDAVDRTVAALRHYYEHQKSLRQSYLDRYYPRGNS
jgi:hypothetical protein